MAPFTILAVFPRYITTCTAFDPDAVGTVRMRYCGIDSFWGKFLYQYYTLVRFFSSKIP